MGGCVVGDLMAADSWYSMILKSVDRALIRYTNGDVQGGQGRREERERRDGREN